MASARRVRARPTANSLMYNLYISATSFGVPAPKRSTRPPRSEEPVVIPNAGCRAILCAAFLLRRGVLAGQGRIALWGAECMGQRESYGRAATGTRSDGEALAAPWPRGGARCPRSTSQNRSGLAQGNGAPIAAGLEIYERQDVPDVQGDAPRGLLLGSTTAPSPNPTVPFGRHRGRLGGATWSQRPRPPGGLTSR